MTAPVPLVERLAEVLCEWTHDHLTPGIAGASCPGARDLARALLPVVEQAVAEARAAALREAAKEAEERGDIGKDCGCEAWEWLRIRADRIGGAE